ncbi:MAG: homoserine dehydrogenase [Bacteroidetes bacterium]|nr:homoserine dehydrogenase [Bacteroidota bacterium]
MKKNLQLGVFGFGCVGQGLYHVLNETKGLKAEIRKIVVKNKSKSRPLPADLFSFDRNDILTNPEIDVVVELIDDPVAAFEILKEALANGKAVVTANKRMLADNLEEIYRLQQVYGKPVLYEGAVCASIPIIRNLEEYYDNDLISSIEGIMNGSTNYILTKVMEEKKSYAESLRQAQDLGFAESDPTLDVRGYDPSFKLAILIAHAFGVFVSPDQIIRFGIDRLSQTDLDFAVKNNLNIRLVGRALKQNGKIYALLATQFVSNTHPLFGVRNEYNAVTVTGAFAEKQTFIGKGAGSYPTGSAVLSDISALTYDYRYEYKKILQENGLTFSNDAAVEILASFKPEQFREEDFIEIKERKSSSGLITVRGTVVLNRLQSWSDLDGVSIVLAPEAALIPFEAAILQPSAS